MINNEQIQALKAAADSCDKQEPLSLVVYHGKMCLRNKGGIVFTVLRDICFPDYSAENENYARLAEACTPDLILSLLAERDADKALIAELKPIAAHAQRGWQEAHEQEALVEQAMTRIDEQAKRISELEASKVVPLTFSEGADADFCREWAWSEIKKELNTDHWNSQDNGNFYGFYLMGWHARRQFNKQRRAENLQIAKEVGLVRTLTVKLPDNCEHDVIAPVCSFMYESGFEIDIQDYNAVAGRVLSEVETVLRRTLLAAGITLVVEE